MPLPSLNGDHDTSNLLSTDNQEITSHPEPNLNELKSIKANDTTSVITITSLTQTNEIKRDKITTHDAHVNCNSQGESTRRKSVTFPAPDWPTDAIEANPSDKEAIFKKEKLTAEGLYYQYEG